MTANVYVANISYQANEKDLEDFLSEFGKINEVKIIKDKESGKSKGFAFVNFVKYLDAADCIREANGRPFMGRDIVVKVAIPPKEKNYNKH